MDWIIQLVRDPNRPEVYLIIGIIALTGAIAKIYRDSRRKDREIMTLLREQISVGNQTISALLVVAAPKDALAQGEDAGVRDAARPASPPNRQLP